MSIKYSTEWLVVTCVTVSETRQTKVSGLVISCLGGTV